MFKMSFFIINERKRSRKLSQSGQKCIPYQLANFSVVHTLLPPCSPGFVYLTVGYCQPRGLIFKKGLGGQSGMLYL